MLLVLGGILGASCTKDELRDPLDDRLSRVLRRASAEGTLSAFVLPDPNDLEAIPQSPFNPLTPQKVALGRMLFFETGLARDAMHESGQGTYSCSSCHIPDAGFMPGRVQGIADGGRGFGRNGEGRTKQANYQEHELDVQGARPLSVLNVAYVENTTWNGKFGAHGVNEGTEAVWGVFDSDTEINHLGYDGLESQNIEGLKVHRMRIDPYVLDTLSYRSLFDAAFPDRPRADRYNLETASFALSAYLRTLLTTQAPFQRWLKGETGALREAEKRGAVLFYDKAGCYRCHRGPALSAVAFYALGVGDLDQTGEAFATGPGDKRHLGRAGFTGDPADLYKFKVPQLYNMADSPFYFHGSSKRSLRAVVDYFNRAVPENSRVPEMQLAPQFQPLHLTEAEVDDLVAFLTHGLRDPALQRYVPVTTLSGNCFPNNDPQSRKESGCE